MEIKKGGLLYEYAYALTLKRKIPEKTNLCRFFWRCMLNWIPILIAGFIACVFAIGAFMVGYRLSNEANEALFVRIAKWPAPFGVRILPVVVLPIVAGILLVISFYQEIFEFFTSFSVSELLIFFSTQSLAYSILGTTAVVAILITIIYHLTRTEFWKVFKGWLRAKKQKVCPIIKFVEQEKEASKKE